MEDTNTDIKKYCKPNDHWFQIAGKKPDDLGCVKCGYQPNSRVFYEGDIDMFSNVG